jgi:putative ABC transport system permease protein
MKLLLNIREALRALRANALRSILTTLGIVFGVASVSVLVAAGAGTQAQIQEDMERLGTSTLLVFPGAARTAGVRMAAGSRPTLTDDDARYLEASIPQLVAAAPIVRGSVQAVAASANWQTTVNGVTDAFFVARDWDAVEGRGFVGDEVEAGRKIALLGATVAEQLFPYDDPIDQMIRVNHLSFRVVGVLESKGQTMDGSDLDDFIAVPLATARNHLIGRSLGSARSIRNIVVKAPEDADLADLEEEVRQALRQRHRLKEDQPDDFTIRNMTEFLKVQEASSGALTALLAAIASISLLVGGIGIMNIMLVSVTERTREIGIRAAVGAGPRDLMGQFLTESVTLSLLGAAIGAAVGIAGAIIADDLFNIRTELTLEPVLLAAGFAITIGVVFGLYPAWKASRLPPIEALRYE